MESERQYDGSKFNFHVCSDFSFEDHNPPTIKMILAFCQHAETQLKEMADRTLVIHCKAGKVSEVIELKSSSSESLTFLCLLNVGFSKKSISQNGL